MKVLITGASGFIGQYVLDECISRGHPVASVDRTVPGRARKGYAAQYIIRLPSPQFASCLREFKPACVIHCAGMASVSHSMDDPNADFVGNVIVTQNVLDSVRAVTPHCHVIFLSSAAIYGQPRCLPVPENAAPSPISPYGYHKRMCELLCEEAHAIHGIPVTVARIFSAYGPRLQRQIIWEICKQAVMLGRITLQGTGSETRDFIHATDVARAVVSLVDRSPRNSAVFNIASGIERSVGSIAGVVAENVGTPPPTYLGRSRPGDPDRWRADIRKLSEIGFSPTVSFDQGISGVIEFARRVTVS